MKTRLAIRKTVYRGNPGFLVMRTGQGMFGERIFVQSRSAAEKIKEKLKNGIEIILEDYKTEAL